MNTFDEMGISVRVIEHYLLQALGEMPPHEGCIYAEELHRYIVKRDGYCVLTIEQIYAWFLCQGCLA